MKKCLCFSIVSQFIALLLLSTASPALAAPISMMAPHTSIMQTSMIIPASPAGRGRTPDNQYVGGRCNNHRIVRYFRGNNLSNSGNRGHNSGFNQDNNTNEGNQLINQGMMGRDQGHNQYYQNCLNIDISTYNIGNNQANTGNGGYNSGFTQDNSTNAGNQIIN